MEGGSIFPAFPVYKKGMLESVAGLVLFNPFIEVIYVKVYPSTHFYEW